VKIRLLLTFDDGPHAHTDLVLKRLRRNRVQSDIKAIFFVQTRSADGGGSRQGRSLLQQEHAEGHVLGLHTGTVRGHISHTSMSLPELDRSLKDGMADICAITGVKPSLVRPPYWWFNRATVAEYERHGLHMMLSDVKAYDGINWGFHVFRRWNFRSQFVAIRRRRVDHEVAENGGVIPIVVAFHDTNAYTAGHVGDYLELLIEEAAQAGLPLDDKPYYDEAPELSMAALRRAVHPLRAASSRRRLLRRDKYVPTG
jgi:peptidoglycan/xylan/chitin deacetylase (PgdA/CDA1 family)